MSTPKVIRRIKKRLWDRLVEVRSSLGEEAWCVVRDFNSVCSREERRGVNGVPSSVQIAEMHFFNNFRETVEWEDVDILGCHFTWYHPNGMTMS